MTRAWLLIACIGAPAAAGAQALTLDDAIRSAVRRDAVARGAALDVEGAGASARQARAALLPNVSVRGSAVRRTVNPSAFGIPGLPAEATDPFSIVDARASARVPLLDLTALNRWRAARQDVVAASASAVRGGDAAAWRAAAAYLNVARAEVIAAARARDVSLASELLRISRERVGAGLAPNIDETRAAARVAEAEALAAESGSEVQRTRIGLEDALDDALLAASPLADSLGALAAADTLSEVAALELARAQRAELVAADARVAAARSRTRAVSAEWIPAVALMGDVGSIGRTRDAMVATWQVGVEVSLPLLDGLSRQARGDAAAVGLAQAELSRREIARAIGLEVRAAYAGLGSLALRERAAREQVRLGELEVEQARSRFSAGVAGNADVVQALAALSRARIALADALTARAAAQLAVRAATGSLAPR